MSSVTGLFACVPHRLEGGYRKGEEQPVSTEAEPSRVCLNALFWAKPSCLCFECSSLWKHSTSGTDKLQDRILAVFSAV